MEKKSNKKNQELYELKQMLQSIPEEIFTTYFQGYSFDPKNIKISDQDIIKYKVIKANDSDIHQSMVNLTFGKKSLNIGINNNKKDLCLDDDEIKDNINNGSLQEVKNKNFSLKLYDNNNKEIGTIETDKNNKNTYNMHFASKDIKIKVTKDGFEMKCNANVLQFNKSRKEVELFSIENNKKEGILTRYEIKNNKIKNKKSFYFIDNKMQNVKIERKGDLYNNFYIICKDGTRIHIHDNIIQHINGKDYSRLPAQEYLPLSTLIKQHNKKKPEVNNGINKIQNDINSDKLKIKEVLLNNNKKIKLPFSGEYRPKNCWLISDEEKESRNDNIRGKMLPIKRIEKDKTIQYKIKMLHNKDEKLINRENNKKKYTEARKNRLKLLTKRNEIFFGKDKKNMMAINYKQDKKLEDRKKNMDDYMKTRAYRCEQLTKRNKIFFVGKNKEMIKKKVKNNNHINNVNMNSFINIKK